MYATKHMRMHDMNFVDNQLGINLNTAGERLTNKIEAFNMKIYGESPADDCPTNSACYCQ